LEFISLTGDELAWKNLEAVKKDFCNNIMHEVKRKGEMQETV
jgi:hypothetical protein